MPQRMPRSSQGTHEPRRSSNNNSGIPDECDLFSQIDPPLRATHHLRWPNKDRFPLNLPHKTTVRAVLMEEILKAKSTLIIAGYASLSELIPLITKRITQNPGKKTRLLFGQEPFETKQKYLPLARGGVVEAYARQVEEYWLEKNISLAHSFDIKVCIDAIRENKVEVRCWPDERNQRMHAKIYVTETSATVGSSNFTRQGLSHNMECNTRFAVEEPDRYQETMQIAENFWSKGEDYSDRLIKLLEKLLRWVEWPDALARACAELLQGEWAGSQLNATLPPRKVSLWPSQKQGIAQALYLLSRQGGVLIADATGSGKTRLGAHLIRILQHQIITSNRRLHGRVMLICPPAVVKNWEKEANDADINFQIVSDGRLSNRSARKKLLQPTRRAQVLCIDEGHKFLNRKANRTAALLRNLADHTIVFTATPINRDTKDLVSMTNLLGADNFDEDVLDAVSTLSKRGSAITDDQREEELNTARSGIRKFTVRRTKSRLNSLIDREPEAYTNWEGKKCRFPEHERPVFYPLNESGKDKEIAAEIKALSCGLNGVARLKKGINASARQRRKKGFCEENYTKRHLLGSKGMACYQIREALRSSTAALVEHLKGTEFAKERFRLKGYQKKSTGDVIQTIKNVAARRPSSNVVPSLLPGWLKDDEMWRRACEQEIAIYEQIFDQLSRLSEARELAKAEKLIEMLGEYSLVLAFDRLQITPHVIAAKLHKLGVRKRGAKVLLAAGDGQSDVAKIMEAFQLGSTAKNIIALCTNKLTEGVNLQQARCAVHLDMPSTVRLVEQRIGRIDRMDSPHKTITICWPDDADEFALTSDDKLLERYETERALWGSNIEMPEGLTDRKNGSGDKRLSYQKLVEDKFSDPDRDLSPYQTDAFGPVYDLIGDDRLVPQATYDAYLNATGRVVSRVSLVRSATKDWAFFCLRGGRRDVPLWVLFKDGGSTFVSDFPDICEFLEKNLSPPEVENLPPDEASSQKLKDFSRRLTQVDWQLLSNRERIAVEQMRHILGQYRKAAFGRREQSRAEEYESIARELNPRHLHADHERRDWQAAARAWMDVIQPVQLDALETARWHHQPFRMRNLDKQLCEQEGVIYPRLMQFFRTIPYSEALETRVAACIVGLAD